MRPIFPFPFKRLEGAGSKSGIFEENKIHVDSWYVYTMLLPASQVIKCSTWALRIIVYLSFWFFQSRQVNIYEIYFRNQYNQNSGQWQTQCPRWYKSPIVIESVCCAFDVLEVLYIFISHKSPVSGLASPSFYGVLVFMEFYGVLVTEFDSVI